MTRLIVFTILSFMSGSSLFAAPKLELAAADACKCLKMPYAQISNAMEAAKQAKKNGDVAALIKTQNLIISVVEDSASCFENLSKKYPLIDQSETLKQQVAELTEKMCPNPASGG